MGSNAVTKFEATPVVIDGILYVTGINNHAWAIDGRTGKEIWRYRRPLPQGLRVCCGPVNRGFATFGDRLYMTTLDAHVVALERNTGKVIWDVELADYRLGYASTVAPLVVKDKLIVGMAGGEYATRGFLDAYDLRDGTRRWRFHTIPAPGEPGGETWPRDHHERGERRRGRDEREERCGGAPPVIARQGAQLRELDVVHRADTRGSSARAVPDEAFPRDHAAQGSAGRAPPRRVAGAFFI